MTPIEQVRPTQPGNWIRRPESRNKRGRPEQPPEHDDSNKNRPGHDPDEATDGREHIDELA